MKAQLAMTLIAFNACMLARDQEREVDFLVSLRTFGPRDRHVGRILCERFLMQSNPPKN